MKLAPLTEVTLAAAPKGATIIPARSFISFTDEDGDTHSYYVATAYRGESGLLSTIIVLGYSTTQPPLIYTSLSSFISAWRGGYIVLPD